MSLFKKSRLFEKISGPKPKAHFKTHKKYGTPVSQASSDLESKMAEYNAAMERALAEARLEIAQNLQQAAASIPANVGRDIENLFDVYREELAQEARDKERQIKQWMDNQKRNLDPLTKFLYGEMIEVVSSNVAAIQYDKEHQFLYIVFKNTAWYRYGSISAEEAESFFFAGSKGGWVWDNLRVRGTVFGHKKPYDFMRYGLGDYQPKYIGNSTWEAEHAAIPQTGEIPESWIADKGPYNLGWLVTRNPKLFPAAKILSSGVEDVGTFADMLNGEVKGKF